MTSHDRVSGTHRVSVMQPDSSGSVRLASADPTAAPMIDPNFFSARTDLDRMIEAITIGKELLGTAPLSRLVDADLSPHDNFGTFASEDVQTYFHPVGTCRMGPAEDDRSVVSPLGRVHSIADLSVIDASIMPTIPSANTNLPTMMLAEHTMRLRQTPLIGTADD